MSQPNKLPKTMSSRLLTMKFMQRAAASTSSPPSTPSEPPSKKQRLSNGSHNSTPASTPRSEAQVIEEVFAAEEQTRNEALELQAAIRGDTKWYLSFKEPQSSVVNTPLRVVSAGYAALDAASSSIDHSTEENGSTNNAPQVHGRRSFGKFNPKLEKQQNPQLSSSESSFGSESGEEDEEDGEDLSDDPTGAKAMIVQSRKAASEKARSERKAKKNAGKAEAERLAAERRKKHVKLNKLTSISGGGGPDPSWKEPHKRITCHRCGEKGHVEKDCHVLAKALGANAK